MKKLYPSGRAMPTRTGSSEPTRSSHATSRERMTTSPKSLLRVRSISPFYSYRRRAMVGSMSATSNLYDVLKKVDWLAIFSPWAIINRSKMYAMTTKQNTCTTRTPAKNVALKDFLRRAPLRSGLAIVRGSTTVLPKIFMVRRAHHDIKPNTCATRTPANNAALKALAIAKGGITVVPKIFSGAFFAFFFAEKKKVPVRHEDKEIVEWEYISRRFATVSVPFSSTLVLLSTVFILLDFGFISAPHAQSRQDAGTAEVVNDDWGKEIKITYKFLFDKKNYEHTKRVNPWADLEKFP